MEQPKISVLITTYNRSNLLRRAINSVLMQDFRDYEVVIIDDCSSDDTPQVVDELKDDRFRYIRNTTNVGAVSGDREHVRRFVYELMRGGHFVYLCDDDYWLYPDLLSRQIKAFAAYPEVAFVMGNQLSYYLTTPESYFGGTDAKPHQFTLQNLDAVFDMEARTSKSPHIGYIPSLFSKQFLTGDEYLQEFAEDPAAKNRIVGATLYSRDRFIRAGAMQTSGAKWQAGYEFLMGPACMGNVVFIDRPCIVTEIRQGNASFQRTQLEHYYDSIKSIETAFDAPIKDAGSRGDAQREAFLKRVRGTTLDRMSRSFLGNALQIRRTGSLGMCSSENMSEPVQLRHVLAVLKRNGETPTPETYELGRVYQKTAVTDAVRRAVRPLREVVRRILPLSARQRSRDAVRSLWRMLPHGMRQHRQ